MREIGVSQPGELDMPDHSSSFTRHHEQANYEEAQQNWGVSVTMNWTL